MTTGKWIQLIYFFKNVFRGLASQEMELVPPPSAWAPLGHLFTEWGLEARGAPLQWSNLQTPGHRRQVTEVNGRGQSRGRRVVVPRRTPPGSGPGQQEGGGLRHCPGQALGGASTARWDGADLGQKTGGRGGE